MTPVDPSEAERRALDVQGFVVLHELFEADRLEVMRTCFDRCAASGEAQGGTRHVEHVPWWGPEMDGSWSHPRILGAVAHVLREDPFHLIQAGGREPQRGFGRQGLHSDWPVERAGEAPVSASVLVLLDPFTADNGATRLVPGSHRVRRALPKAMRAPAARHPDEALVEAPAGSALVFDSFLLHSGDENRSGARRRVLQCQFGTRSATQAGTFPEETPARWDAATRALLGRA